MKKMLKSKKGFSLIELLIVVAILAILAAISINLFGGVLTKQKDKSDKAACSYLQTAIQTYIADADDGDLSELGLGSPNPSFTILMNKLSSTFTNSDGKKYGPYLNVAQAKLSSTGMTFEIAVDTDTEAVKVGTISGTTPTLKVQAGATLTGSATPTPAT